MKKLFYLFAIIIVCASSCTEQKTVEPDAGDFVKKSKTVQRGHYITDPRFTETYGDYDENYLSMLVRFYNSEQAGYVGLLWHSKSYTDTAEISRINLIARIESYSGATIFPLLLKYGLAADNYQAVAFDGEWWGDQLDTNDYQSFMKVVANWGHYTEEFEWIYRLAPEEDMPLLKALTWHEPLSITFAEMELRGEDGRDTLASYIEYQREALEDWLENNPDYLTENGVTEYHIEEPRREEVSDKYYYMWLIEEAEAAAKEK